MARAYNTGKNVRAGFALIPDPGDLKAMNVPAIMVEK